MKTALRLLFLIALSAVFALFAQKPNPNQEFSTRTVQGTVTTADKQPVNRAVVQLKDTKTLQIRSFITEQDGKYHFTGLSTNVDYELRAQLDEARSKTKRLDVFNTKRVATVNLKLKNKKK